ncbi:MAG: TolC family protein [Elusimicrobiales bacterium]|nr:TolC family protein [Elusimicrobiales bacterium]
MNIPKRIFLMFIFHFLMSGSFLFAEANEKKNILIITLDDAVKMALNSSEDLKMASNNRETALSNLLKAKQEKLPYLSTSFSWTKNLQYPTGIGMNDYSMDFGLSLSQKIFTFGRMKKNIDMASKQSSMSELDEDLLKRETIYLTKFAYYRIYLAKKIHEIHYESLERARQNKTLLEERSSSGRASKYDNIKAESDIAGRLPSVNDAKASLNTIIHTFIILLGFDDFDLASKVDISNDIFKDEYEPMDHRKLIEKLLLHHPALKKLKLAVAASKDRIDMLGKLYYPEISAFSSYNKSGYGASFIPGPSALNDYAMLGIRFNLALFDAGRRKENISQAEILKNNAGLALEKKRKELILNLENAISKYNELIKTLKANEKAISLAETSFNMSQDRFRSGYLSVTNLNDAELYLTGQKIKKEITLVNLEINLAEIENLSGAIHE